LWPVPEPNAKHAGVIEIGSAVTRRTGHAGSAVAILAAHDERLMQPPQVRLARLNPHRIQGLQHDYFHAVLTSRFDN
jgi:hypothetical protein